MNYVRRTPGGPAVREVFAPAEKQDPGEVFYTITERDLGKRVIDTEVGAIFLAYVIGYVLPTDVGRRLYRVRDAADDSWVWTAENNRQMQERLERQGS